MDSAQLEASSLQTPAETEDWNAVALSDDEDDVDGRNDVALVDDEDDDGEAGSGASDSVLPCGEAPNGPTQGALRMRKQRDGREMHAAERTSSG